MTILRRASLQSMEGAGSPRYAPILGATTGTRTTEFEALCRRVLGEFREMPGLCLTLAQASRLFGLPPATCLRVLRYLVDGGLLYERSDGSYALMRPVGGHHSWQL